MAAQQDASSTGYDAQGELRKRNVQQQANGNYVPKEMEGKLDEKSKEKV